MANEHGIERGPNEHTDDGDPNFCGILGWPPPESNAEHVGDCLEYGPGVLSAHGSILIKE